VISQNSIQQILGRLDITDVIGGFVKLKKRGANYLGLCPFHNEKTPSFTVSPSKELYKCFGCGRSGNAVSFLMEHEKYSYPEALRWLANKYGIEIEETYQSDEQRLQLQAADSLYIINSFAQQFFSQQLFETEEGRDIGLAYFKERGYREDVIKKFQLGYSPEQRDAHPNGEAGRAFTKEAIAKQYNTELLIRSGLIASRNEQLVDNYRGRVIFPVHNHSGKVLGFGARVLKSNDKVPKYINTPENEIYIKSKILYGSYFARQAIDKADECLLVEGYTDVISLHQAGLENVVASGGTSLTPDQLRLIKKYSNNLTIIYDGDAAGVKAALRGLDLALEEGLNVKLVLIPDKDDPDSYVNKVGASAFSDFIKKNKKDFILFQLEVALKDAGSDSVKKSEVVNRIAETISRINKAEDFTKQQDYIRQCAEILKIDEAGMHSLVNKFIRERITSLEKRQVKEDTSDFVTEPARTDFSDEAFNVLFMQELQEKAIARVLLEFGLKQWDANQTVFEYMANADLFEDKEIPEERNVKIILEEDLYENKRVPLIVNQYSFMYKGGLNPTTKTFVNHENRDISLLAIEATNHPYELSPKWTKDEMATKVNRRIWGLNYQDFFDEAINNDEAGKIIYHHEIDENYRDDVNDVLIYLKLKKIKRLLASNIDDMKKNHTPEELKVLLDTHNFLKEQQASLAKKKGIVIYPF